MNATTKAMHIGRGKLPVEAVVMQTALADANREANNQTIAPQNEDHLAVIIKNELPPTGVVPLNPSRLYSVEDIAKIVGLSNSWVYAKVSTLKPLVKGKQGHKLLYGFDFVQSLLTQQSTKDARVEPEEHADAHGTVIDRLIAIEHYISKLHEREQKIIELDNELQRMKKLLGS